MRIIKSSFFRFSRFFQKISINLLLQIPFQLLRVNNLFHFYIKRNFLLNNSLNLFKSDQLFRKRLEENKLQLNRNKFKKEIFYLCFEKKAQVAKKFINF